MTGHGIGVGRCGIGSASEPDLRFYFDPVCQFSWLTSKWVRQVVAARKYTVEWRLISLRIVNDHIDYATHFPPDYKASHNAGLRMLRVAARARTELGQPAVDALQASFGEHIFEIPPWPDQRERSDTVGSPDHVARILAAAGLPPELVEALDDTSWDTEIQAETFQALALTGTDVGTPILHFEPPDGVALFGPVISRMPSPQEAVELWDHVTALARFGGFAELKRSLRERPQLPVFGTPAGEVGMLEDWHQGSRQVQR